MADAAPVSGPEGYWIVCDLDGPGSIHGPDGERYLRFQPCGSRMTFLDDTDRTPLIATSERWGSLARWVLVGTDKPTCVIRCRNVWRGKYSLEFTSGPLWTLRIPLFTVIYRATSDHGSRFRVRVRHHTQWYVEAPNTPDDLAILAGLALIQRHRQWA